MHNKHFLPIFSFIILFFLGKRYYFNIFTHPYCWQVEYKSKKIIKAIIIINIFDFYISYSIWIGKSDIKKNSKIQKKFFFE